MKIQTSTKTYEINVSEIVNTKILPNVNKVLAISIVFLGAYAYGMCTAPINGAVIGKELKPNLQYVEPDYREILDQSVQDKIIELSDKYGADSDLMLRIAYCESRYNPESQNGSSTAGGVYQFIDGTWNANATRHWGDQAKYKNKYDANDNIELATWMVASGGLSHWNASKSCWN